MGDTAVALPAQPSPSAPTSGTLQKLLSAVEEQDVTIGITTNHDVGVHSVETSTGKKWVVRSFTAATPQSAIEQVVEILRFVESHDFPAERAPATTALSVVDGMPLLVTEFIPGITPKGDKDTCRELGRLLGVLQKLPYAESYNCKRGGGWHHVVAAGGIEEEVAASKALLEKYATRAGNGLEDEQGAAIRQLSAQLDDMRDKLAPLPIALVHPDVVAVNTIKRDDGTICLVDWVGSGLGPRIWPLGFLLLAVSYRSIKLVDVVLGAYCKLVRLTGPEAAALAHTAPARFLVIGCWEINEGRKTPQDVLKEHEERVVQSAKVYEQAKPIFIRGGIPVE